MLKCNQVSRLVASDDFRELGMFKKMEFKMHLMMCSHCQRYFDQIRSLGRGARQEARKLEADDQQIEKMEFRIREELNRSEG